MFEEDIDYQRVGRAEARRYANAADLNVVGPGQDPSIALTPKMSALQCVIEAMEMGCTAGDIHGAVDAVTDYLRKDQGGR